MPALESPREPDEQYSTALQLPAAAGMLRGALVLHLPPRRRPAPEVLLGTIDVSDAAVDEFVAELRALGGMAVVA